MYLFNFFITCYFFKKFYNYNENKSFELSALCLPLICLPLKKQPLNYVQNLPEFVELNFADTGDTGNEIDLLIGSDFYWSLVTGNVKPLEKSSLIAIETKLGWVFSGPVNIPHSTNMSIYITFLPQVNHM